MKKDSYLIAKNERAFTVYKKLLKQLDVKQRTKNKRQVQLALQQIITEYNTKQK